MDEALVKYPHAGERLTRGDVLRLIEEHGGAEGLDLREADLREANLSQLNLRGVDLSYANLQGANLFQASLQGADILHAKLQKANLQMAHLTKAKLLGANLQAASLAAADLQEAILRGADLRRACLTYANLRDADFDHANWGDYKLGEEVPEESRPDAGIIALFGSPPSAYRALKQRHTEVGMYDIAGEFHYREMEARRKLAWRDSFVPYPRYWLRLHPRPSLMLEALTLYALRFLYGYGERPERVIGWAAAIIFGLGAIYWAFGTVSGGFLNTLYYSAVSFTALGYGWAAEPQGWAGKFLGVGESLLGVFMMALFLVTFTRKMTR